MAKFFLPLLFVASCVPALAADKPYNVHEYSWSARGLDDKSIKLEGKGEASRARKAWRAVRRHLNGLARRGDLEDWAPLLVEVKWRGRKFVRVIYSHKSNGPWPCFPKKGRRWAYDPISQEARCYPSSRD